MIRLNNTQLKVLAVVTMTIDHVGAFLLPSIPLLRAIGRLAFPIFAYMIAEGCRHTSNKARYLVTLCAFGAISQLLFWLHYHTLYQSIFTTLALSAVTIFALQWWAESWQGQTTGTTARSPLNLRVLAPLAALALDVVVTVVLPQTFALQGFYVQYRLPGVLLPVMAYLPWLANPGGVRDEQKNRLAALVLFAIGLVIVAATGSSSNQWWSLLALVPLALYNGERGSRSLKYFFYVYYPLHLAVIMLLARFLASPVA